MNIISQIHNPTLPGAPLFQPAKYFCQGMGDSLAKCRAVLESIRFLVFYKHLIPEAGRPSHLKCDQVAAFHIRFNGHSDYVLFQHDRFEWRDDLLLRERDPAYAGHSYERILCVEAVVCTARAVAWLAVSVLTLVVTVPLAAVGAGVNGLFFCCGSNAFKRPLKVTELQSAIPVVKQSVAQIARDWQQLSWTKNLSCRDGASEQFQDAATVSKLIAQCMEHPDQTKWIWDRVFVCSAVPSSRMQGLLLTKESWGELKIAHIVTHPGNIRSAVNAEDYTRVEGAGTALIAHVAKESLEKKISKIYLESVPSANGFYTKLGFEEEVGMPSFEPGCIPMHLTQAKMQRLVDYANQPQPKEAVLAEQLRSFVARVQAIGDRVINALPYFFTPRTVVV